jgi:hypothetical protein
MHGVGVHSFVFVCLLPETWRNKQTGLLFLQAYFTDREKNYWGNLIAPAIGLFDTAWALWLEFVLFLSRFWRFFCYLQAVFASAFNDRNNTEGANRPHVIIRRVALDALQR